MISVDVPEYMINTEDMSKSDNAFVNFSINYRENMLEIFEELRKVIPHTVNGWVDENNHIKANIIIVCNDKILNKSKLNEQVVFDGAHLEFLTQFAGG